MENYAEIGRLILEWANLVESGDSEMYVPPKDGIICFFDGKWHDSSGNPIDVPPEAESSVVHTISRIESENYRSVPDLIMMDGFDSLFDISEYLDCEIDDMFIFYRFPSAQIREWKSPSSEDPALSGSIYFLASANEYAGIGWSEVADISGNLEGTSVFSKLLSAAFSWLKERNLKLVIQNCRESTSERLFTSGPVLRKFLGFGFMKLDDVD